MTVVPRAKDFYQNVETQIKIEPVEFSSSGSAESRKKSLETLIDYVKSLLFSNDFSTTPNLGITSYTLTSMGYSSVDVPQLIADLKALVYYNLVFKDISFVVGFDSSSKYGIIVTSEQLAASFSLVDKLALYIAQQVLNDYHNLQNDAMSFNETISSTTMIKIPVTLWVSNLLPNFSYKVADWCKKSLEDKYDISIYSMFYQNEATRILSVSWSVKTLVRGTI